MNTKTLLLLTFHFLLIANVGAQTNRALLIGINDYIEDQPMTLNFESDRDWRNLRGCVNDAKAIQSLLMTRYGFDETNINFIENKSATRDNILTGFEQLISDSQKGDVVFVFYAGHGSFMINEDSEESDKIDETIVPVDAAEGVADIRDKEIRNYLNQLIDKIGEDKGKLTVIFDSCHSGSATRGEKSSREEEYVNDMLLGKGGFGVRHLDGQKSRGGTDMEVDPRIPSERGALVISSCQDHQTSKEKTYSDMGAQHGDFTYALIQAVNNSPSDASTSMIFSSIKNYLRIHGKQQTPSMEATSERLAYNLFGVSQTRLVEQTVLSVSEIDLSNKEIILNGGVALGVHPGCVLRGLTISNEDAVLEITQSIGLTYSKAIALSNIEEVQENDYFVVDQMVSADQPNLAVCISSTELATADLLEQSEKLSATIKNSNGTISFDPTSEGIDYSLFYQSDAWQLKSSEKLSKIRLNDAESLLSITKNATVLFDLPATKDLGKLLVDSLSQGNTSVKISNNPSACKYHLAGRIKNNQIEYCWRQFGTTDPLASSLPIKSDWVQADGDCGKTLINQAYRLAKINAWLMLESPRQAKKSFPYRLMIKDDETTNILQLNDTLQPNCLYSFVLKSTLNPDQKIRKSEVSRRYIYVVTLDPDGKMYLYYPSGGSKDNIYPICESVYCPSVIKIGTSELGFRITGTAGCETFMLITSDVEISSASLVFTVEGVRTRGRGGASDLEKLLLSTGVRTRSSPPPIPENWSIDKISMISRNE
jgi:hypothetical protein